MWIENQTFKADLEHVCRCGFIPWENFNNKTVLITGATGLVGYTITSALLYYYLISKVNGRVLLLVRDLEKAKAIFCKQLASGSELKLISGSVENLPEMEDSIDYIIHCACPTASSFFVANPVDTMNIIAAGTERVLQLAQKKQISGMIYLSSMEVFGEVKVREKLKEEDLGYINICSPRSSYSEGKRFAESLCSAYANQYQLPVTVARLAQTFGPGVQKDDGRVFAYIARCAVNREDIRLNTSGRKENMYLYTMDAASAILLLLANGTRGLTYNVGNPTTYCSIKSMAQLVANGLCGGQISVVTNAGEQNVGLYPPESYLNMDVSRLEAMGWRAEIPLLQMFRNMIRCF